MFVTGAQMGLRPDDVLDMNLGQYQAMLEGYNLRLIDQHVIAIHTGYWSSYYNNSKRPKSPSVLAKKLFKSSKKKKSQKPDVDVDTFLRREKKLQQYRKRVNK